MSDIFDISAFSCKYWESSNFCKNVCFWAESCFKECSGSSSIVSFGYKNDPFKGGSTNDYFCKSLGFPKGSFNPRLGFWISFFSSPFGFDDGDSSVKRSDFLAPMKDFCKPPPNQGGGLFLSASYIVLDSSSFLGTSFAAIPDTDFFAANEFLEPAGGLSGIFPS